MSGAAFAGAFSAPTFLPSPSRLMSESKSGNFRSDMSEKGRFRRSVRRGCLPVSAFRPICQRPSVLIKNSIYEYSHAFIHFDKVASS